ncbi:MAG: 3-phosphoshikimate 1-carboxyvinyltransferase [Flavobacteriales bacterium]|nr:MAG: 3-phosphoshikimate 1-carboxyvinyltransferase [Flavobacteriales bacterium]
MFLDYTGHRVHKPTLILPGSKSESNRALILAQFIDKLTISNLSTADDTKVMQEALLKSSGTIDIGHAGTAMRFLTAYYAVSDNTDVILTGSQRMQERPIKPLVEALKSLGANIQYLNKEGYPPLRIKGQALTKNTVSIQAGISSQYISALMLVGAFIRNGLDIHLTGSITSLPYLRMTAALMESLGISLEFLKDRIVIAPYNQTNTASRHINIESDWTLASYHYSVLALSPVGSSMILKHFRKSSWQGDQKLTEIYKTFGVETEFLPQHAVRLTKKSEVQVTDINLDLNPTPDLAQTIAVTCLGLGIHAYLSGLHTLTIKETDRLQALKNEMEKLGADTNITANTLVLKSHDTLNAKVRVQTYGDHRMAMAFAPLALKTPVFIENPEVVSKSYPEFWNNWEKMFK